MLNFFVGSPGICTVNTLIGLLCNENSLGALGVAQNFGLLLYVELGPIIIRRTVRQQIEKIRKKETEEAMIQKTTEKETEQGTAEKDHSRKCNRDGEWSNDG